MRAEDVRNKKMAEETKLPEGRVLVKVLKPFKYNGEFVDVGQEINMNEDRAVNHMRVGDLERDESLIEKVKARRIAAAEAAKSDAAGEW